MADIQETIEGMNRDQFAGPKRWEPTLRKLVSQLGRRALRLLISGVVLACLFLIAAVPVAFVCVNGEKDATHAWALMTYLTAIAFIHTSVIEPRIGRLLDLRRNVSAAE